MRRVWLLGALGLLAGPVTALYASDADEFKIKRQELFEFTERPSLTRQGDRVEIAFASKAFCDATVAVEDEDGRIVRHLASGVLGPNAPEPFTKGALRQTVVWDGKGDCGKYWDAKDRLTVRVSLGLNPRLERSLFWSPHKQVSSDPPLLCAAPEGVYVFDGMGADHLRLFDHEGNFVRTVYPFPENKIGQVQGLEWQTSSMDGHKMPVKRGYYESTLLRSGRSGVFTAAMQYGPHGAQYGLYGRAASALSVQDGRIALAGLFLSRIASDGTSGGRPLTGPATTVKAVYRGKGAQDSTMRDEVCSESAALNTHDRRLYLAGFSWDKFWNDGSNQNYKCLHGVFRMPFDEEGKMELFLGSDKEDGFGADNAHFKCATSVACDAQGRLYVSDYMNNRVQVYTSAGLFVQSVPAHRPALVRVHPKSGELFVFSWLMANPFLLAEKDPETISPTLTCLGALGQLRERPASIPLPLGIPAKISTWKGSEAGHLVRAEIDTWTDPPTVWLGEPKAGLRLLVLKEGTLALRRNFATEARQAVTSIERAHFSRQRLYVNPRTGWLYVGEGHSAHYKAFRSVLEIAPETGKVKAVELPFDAEDMAFDREGLAYLRSRTVLARYDPQHWREIPFDYGEELPSVGTATYAGRRAAVLSGIHGLYGTWHSGGLSVSARGNIVVQCNATKGDSVPTIAARVDEKQAGEVKDATHSSRGNYLPAIFPGRYMYGEVHIFNKHGQRIVTDALPGIAYLNGIFLDTQDNLFVLTEDARLLDGKPYENLSTGTLMKFKAGRGKYMTSAPGGSGTHVPVPLSKEAQPSAAPQVLMGTGNSYFPAWVEGAAWMYGGVGLSGTKTDHCNCSNSRFWLDDFARSFAPELSRHAVAVLDANGNLMLRVGRYGNVEDGLPLVRDGGPPNPRSIGGDEVSLFYAPYVATHTDRRLFIADPGNARIVSVKLDYHATARVPLKTVPDRR